MKYLSIRRPFPLFLLTAPIALFFFLKIQRIEAYSSLDVVINEIAWMGNEDSHAHEWIELYNNSSSSISLDDWSLISEDGSPKISLLGAISANDFYLLERTDDKTVPLIVSDLIYKGTLNNKGEYLRLFDDLGNVIDEVDCTNGWFAGDNESKKTMERILPVSEGKNPRDWQTSINKGGSPKNLNIPVSLKNNPLPRPSNNVNHPFPLKEDGTLTSQESGKANKSLSFSSLAARGISLSFLAAGFVLTLKKGMIPSTSS